MNKNPIQNQRFIFKNNLPFYGVEWGLGLQAENQNHLQRVAGKHQLVIRRYQYGKKKLILLTDDFSVQLSKSWIKTLLSQNQIQKTKPFLQGTFQITEQLIKKGFGHFRFETLDPGSDYTGHEIYALIGNRTHLGYIGLDFTAAYFMDAHVDKENSQVDLLVVHSWKREKLIAILNQLYGGFWQTNKDIQIPFWNFYAKWRSHRLKKRILT